MFILKTGNKQDLFYRNDCFTKTTVQNASIANLLISDVQVQLYKTVKIFFKSNKWLKTRSKKKFCSLKFLLFQIKCKKICIFFYENQTFSRWEKNFDFKTLKKTAADEKYQNMKRTHKTRLNILLKSTRF